MPKVRLGTINRLAARIEKAEERGDLDGFRVLLNQMIDIATVESPDHTPEATLAACQWLAANDGRILDHAPREHVWKHPEILVDAVKTMRRYASSPRTSPAARRDALAALKKYGFDDESLKDEAG